LPTTRHRCNLDCVGLGAKPRRWAPPRAQPGGGAKGAEVPSLARSKLRKKIISFNF